MPEAAKPRKIHTLQVQATSTHAARKAIMDQLAQRGLTVRSFNRGHREFIVYVAHPEDAKNATPNP